MKQERSSQSHPAPVFTEYKTADQILVGSLLFISIYFLAFGFGLTAFLAGAAFLTGVTFTEASAG